MQNTYQLESEQNRGTLLGRNILSIKSRSLTGTTPDPFSLLRRRMMMKMMRRVSRRTSCSDDDDDGYVYPCEYTIFMYDDAEKPKMSS